MAQEDKGKGTKKYGRNKRPIDSAMSLFIKDKIPFEKYAIRSGIKLPKVK